MAFKFAHLADVHLGAFRDNELRELNLEAFKKAIDACIRERVDFVIISGDLFHISLPDLSVVDEAVKKLSEAREAGLRFYLVYGSHDYSPTETSVIDVLASAGVLTKVHAIEGDAPRLEFVKDESGAIITGVCARKRGLERKWFQSLDASAVAAQKGFKIFVFHSAVEEFKPASLKEIQAIPVEWLPKGFDYYAGGHVHSRSENLAGGKKIVFPGALFAADFRDLEDASKNPHGFYFIEVDGAQAKMRFQPIELCKTELMDFDAGGKNAFAANEELLKAAEGVDAGGKIVLLRARGELASGKPSEIDFGKVKEVLAGARVLVINRGGLGAKEELPSGVRAGASREEVEEKIFAEALAGFETPNGFLKTKGAGLARELLKALSNEKPDGSTKSDYENVLVKAAGSLLELREEK